MNILGIETSCDETAVAVVQDGKSILSNVLYSQIKDHEKYSGVVPEIAARKHLEKINPLIDIALKEANLTKQNVNAIAVTHKPGLIGSLLIGLNTAKAMAYTLNIPLIPVNHIDAHLFAPHLTQDIPFPHLGLVISGGHTLLYVCQSHLDHILYGSTIDDAIGEAFDKVAKYLNLGYPGGPIIDHLAKKGDETCFPLPDKVFIKDERLKYSFSYSGLKTSTIFRYKKQLEKGQIPKPEDVCAGFQKTAVQLLYDKVLSLAQDTDIRHVVIGGGVSCNSHVREKFLGSQGIKAYFATPQLSLDNGAMVAGLGYYLHQKGITSDMSLDAYSRIIGRNRETVKNIAELP